MSNQKEKKLVQNLHFLIQQLNVNRTLYNQSFVKTKKSEELTYCFARFEPTNAMWTDQLFACDSCEIFRAQT